MASRVEGKHTTILILSGLYENVDTYIRVAPYTAQFKNFNIELIN